mmetsp:Transcript_17640/g.45121  ORF Transcript_17640/g.45121 Transcript_17640/m.45121 type:complete len:221 (+) Transcript_17640:170-832(+)
MRRAAALLSRRCSCARPAGRQCCRRGTLRRTCTSCTTTPMTTSPRSGRPRSPMHSRHVVRSARCGGPQLRSRLTQRTRSCAAYSPRHLPRTRTASRCCRSPSCASGRKVARYCPSRMQLSRSPPVARVTSACSRACASCASPRLRSRPLPPCLPTPSSHVSACASWAPRSLGRRARWRSAARGLRRRPSSSLLANVMRPRTGSRRSGWRREQKASYKYKL